MSAIPGFVLVCFFIGATTMTLVLFIVIAALIKYLLTD